jgi:hypothetical protein
MAMGTPSQPPVPDELWHGVDDRGGLPEYEEPRRKVEMGLAIPAATLPGVAANQTPPSLRVEVVWQIVTLYVAPLRSFFVPHWV